MSIYSVGLTALYSAQIGLTTTGHNIANASTPGYRRQEAIQSTNQPISSGNGFIGQGVNVSTVRRIYDDFLERQVSQNESQSGYLDRYLQNIQQIDNVMGNRAAGFSAAIQNFFSSWNDLANYPSSVTARQAVLGAANTVANSINNLGDYLRSMQNSVNSDITTMTGQVNSYASSIAKMNDRISTAQSSGQQPPNDLLDQRDQLVAELNQLVGTTTIKDPHTGNVDVFMSGGYQLVSGTTSNAINATASLYDASRIELFDAGGSVSISGGTSVGGTLGAMLDYRSQTLDLAQNSLGRIAIAMTDSVNALHTAGTDPAGNFGDVFFNDLDSSPLVFGSSSNTGGATVTATVLDSKLLTNSDYRLSVSGGVYTLSRLSDGQSWSDADIGNLSIIADQGFSLSESVASANGDSFLIRPTVAASNSVSVAVTDPMLIAAADPTAVADDTLDNRTALAIAALQGDRTVVFGNNTLESAYSSLVGEIGNKTSEIEINQKAQQNLLSQVRQAQQSASGVNLDEEAANLIRYQQAYQAAAKLISTASTMFDTLLQIG